MVVICIVIIIILEHRGGVLVWAKVDLYLRLLCTFWLQIVWSLWNVFVSNELGGTHLWLGLINLKNWILLIHASGKHITLRVVEFAFKIESISNIEK